MKTSDLNKEANAFAMALLMPAEWLRKDIIAIGGIDVEDKKKIQQLAKRYRVSVPIITLRLGILAAGYAKRDEVLEEAAKVADGADVCCGNPVVVPVCCGYALPCGECCSNPVSEQACCGKPIPAHPDQIASSIRALKTAAPSQEKS